MKFEPLNLPDIIKITPKIHKDDRGEFMESFKAEDFNKAINQKIEFVQDNQSLSLKPFTIRGLHYQAPPYAQGKLVRCIKGSIFDVAVDIRKSSPNYGQWAGAKLSAQNYAQLWIPAGFLHGFATLESNTIVQYKCTQYYSHSHDGNIAWDDPDLAIDWGIEASKAILSDKDKAAPAFADFETPF